MLLRYVLFFVLVWAFWRFLDHLIGLGRRSLGRGQPVDGVDPSSQRSRPGWDIADADFEILPEDPSDGAEPGS